MFPTRHPREYRNPVSPHKRAVGVPDIEVVAQIERRPGFEGFIAVIYPATGHQ